MPFFINSFSAFSRFFFRDCLAEFLGKLTQPSALPPIGMCGATTIICSWGSGMPPTPFSISRTGPLVLGHWEFKFSLFWCCAEVLQSTESIPTPKLLDATHTGGQRREGRAHMGMMLTRCRPQEFLRPKKKGPTLPQNGVKGRGPISLTPKFRGAKFSTQKILDASHRRGFTIYDS